MRECTRARAIKFKFQMIILKFFQRITDYIATVTNVSCEHIEPNRLRELVFPKGTIVTCPNCGSRIAETLEDGYSGDIIKASSFKGIEQEIKPLDRMNCKKCGTSYFIKGKMHTTKGWI